jgi:N utilization substance protein B
MPSVDRNILRLAVYEMTHLDTPAAVVIDEALELARRYSNEESVQFVNGVLDAVHRDLGRGVVPPKSGFRRTRAGLEARPTGTIKA